MKFLVVKKTKNENLLLKSEENEPVRNKTKLFLKKKEIGFVFETIGRVKSPLYLAKATCDLERIDEGAFLESR